MKNIYKKRKKNSKKENEKVANRKLGNLGNLGNIIPSFRFCPTTKIENWDLKMSEKISEISEFSTWPCQVANLRISMKIFSMICEAV